MISGYCMSFVRHPIEGPEINADFHQLTSPRLVALKRPWVGTAAEDALTTGSRHGFRSRTPGCQAREAWEEELKGEGGGEGKMKSVTLVGDC